MATESRQLNTTERGILEQLLEQQFPGSKQLKQQLDRATVRDTEDTDNYGSIYLEVANTTAKADVTDRVPVEAVAKDDDGVPINILLHVVDGYLNELEIFKADGSQIHIQPSADSLQIVGRH